MPTTTYEFEPRVSTLDAATFHGRHAVVVFEKTQGHHRRVTGRLEVSPEGDKVTVYRPTDGKFRTLRVPYVVRIVVLDYVPPA